MAGLVARGLEERRHPGFSRVQVGPGRDAPDAGEQMVAAGEQRGTARGTGRRDDKVAVHGRFGGELIEVRRFDPWISGEPEVAVPLVVADDEQHMGACCVSSGVGRWECGAEEDEQSSEADHGVLPV